MSNAMHYYIRSYFTWIQHVFTFLQNQLSYILFLKVLLQLVFMSFVVASFMCSSSMRMVGMQKCFVLDKNIFLQPFLAYLSALFSFVYAYRGAKEFIVIMKVYYRYFQKHLMSPYLQCCMRLGMVIYWRAEIVMYMHLYNTFFQPWYILVEDVSSFMLCLMFFRARCSNLCALHFANYIFLPSDASGYTPCNSSHRRRNLERENRRGTCPLPPSVTKASIICMPLTHQPTLTCTSQKIKSFIHYFL